MLTRTARGIVGIVSSPTVRSTSLLPKVEIVEEEERHLVVVVLRRNVAPGTKGIVSTKKGTRRETRWSKCNPISTQGSDPVDVRRFWHASNCEL